MLQQLFLATGSEFKNFPRIELFVTLGFNLIHLFLDYKIEDLLDPVSQTYVPILMETVERCGHTLFIV